MDYEAKLRELMSEKRYRHSLGVRDEAVRMAKHYGADENKAALAGLLHDVVKDFSYVDMIHTSDRYGIELDEVVRSEPKLIHANLGAYYIRNELGVTDDDIFDAVYYHTTSKAAMPLLTKIIYIADSIEPNRDFEGVELLRLLAYKDLDKAILTALNRTIIKLVSSNRMLHTQTVNAMNYLLMKGCTL